MNRRTLLLSLTALALVAGGGGWLALRMAQQNDTAAFADRIRAQMIAVEGGSFSAGNYDSALMPGASEAQPLPVAGPALPAYPVTLASYLLQDKEVTWADLDRYLAAQSRPIAPHYNLLGEKAAPDLPARTDWQTAQDYCAWAGGIAGLAMRLPTEAEWEFAARSRGLTVPWPTDDGRFRPGENLPAEGPEARTATAAVGHFPPNPLGFYDMLAGEREWVADRAGSDPGTVRILKGSDNMSDLMYETIPVRLAQEPASADLVAAMRSRGDDVPPGDAPFYPGGGLRCAADAPG